MQPNTLTRREYKGNIYVYEYYKKLLEDPKHDPDPEPTGKQDPDTDPKKKHSGSTNPAYKVKEENGGLYFLRVQGAMS